MTTSSIRVAFVVLAVSLGCAQQHSVTDASQEKANALYIESLGVVDEFVNPVRVMEEADFQRLDVAVDRLEFLTGIPSGTDSPYGRVVLPSLAEAVPRWEAWYTNNNSCIYFDEMDGRIIIRPTDNCPVASDPVGPGVIVEE